MTGALRKQSRAAAVRDRLGQCIDSLSIGALSFCTRAVLLHILTSIDRYGLEPSQDPSEKRPLKEPASGPDDDLPRKVAQQHTTIDDSIGVPRDAQDPSVPGNVGHPGDLDPPEEHPENRTKVPEDGLLSSGHGEEMLTQASMTTDRC